MEKPTTPCWEWQGERSHNGYGRTRIGTKRRAVHRWIYENIHGDIPIAWDVMHLCDNPPCIRLDHLQAGPKDINIAMKVERDRQARGEGHAAAKLTAEDVLYIHQSTEKGRALADAFGVSEATISGIRHGRTWRHITQKESTS